MIYLVCGGRKYTDRRFLHWALSTLNNVELIIHGGADGADKLADDWARVQGIHCAEVKALWGYYDNKAGPIRNQIMAKLKPDMCIAFPGGTGTADMIARCESAGIPVQRFY